MIPGPASYTNNGVTLKRAPSTHIIPRRNDPFDRLRQSESPGVGKYNPIKPYIRSQSFCIPREKRACTELNDNIVKPGPGSY